MKFSKRTFALSISILLFLLSMLLNYIYRPYIYKNHIYDFHLADTFTSWISIPCATLFFWAIYKKYSFAKGIRYTLIGFIFYEIFLGLTFDYYDIVALFLSGIVTYLIYWGYKRYKKD
jgi:hypothetical protein